MPSIFVDFFDLLGVNPSDSNLGWKLISVSRYSQIDIVLKYVGESETFNSHHYSITSWIIIQFKVEFVQ